MKVLYRPQRSTLEESMKDLEEFSSLIDMFQYLAEKHDYAFWSKDVVLQYYCFDERISWHTYAVCVRRYGGEDYIKLYGSPQIIGFCNIVE